MKVGVVLEGGAMRGMFTVGILDAMMDEGLQADGTIGVSAGACFGVNYKSRQRGRAIAYNKRFARDIRYGSTLSYIATGNYYNARFAYHIVPTKYDIFDNEAFEANPMKFYVVCTDIVSGKPIYKECEHGGHEFYEWVRASASMPVLSRPVRIDGYKLLDGGMTDSVPLAYFESIGYERNIVILTQPKGYVKGVNPTMPIIKLFLHKYPMCSQAMQKRHIMYNAQIDYVEQAEREGRCLILRPDDYLLIGHVSHSPTDMQRVYDIGYAYAKRRMEEIREFFLKA